MRRARMNPKINKNDIAANMLKILILNPTSNKIDFAATVSENIDIKTFKEYVNFIAKNIYGSDGLESVEEIFLTLDSEGKIPICKDNGIVKERLKNGQSVYTTYLRDTNRW